MNVTELSNFNFQHKFSLKSHRQKSVGANMTQFGGGTLPLSTFKTKAKKPKNTNKELDAEIQRQWKANNLTQQESGVLNAVTET